MLNLMVHEVTTRLWRFK